MKWVGAVFVWWIHGCLPINLIKIDISGFRRFDNCKSPSLIQGLLTNIPTFFIYKRHS